jgi:hypothetical protein
MNEIIIVFLVIALAVASVWLFVIEPRGKIHNGCRCWVIHVIAVRSKSSQYAKMMTVIKTPNGHRIEVKIPRRRKSRFSFLLFLGVLFLSVYILVSGGTLPKLSG